MNWVTYSKKGDNFLSYEEMNKIGLSELQCDEDQTIEREDC